MLFLLLLQLFDVDFLLLDHLLLILLQFPQPVLHILLLLQQLILHLVVIPEEVHLVVDEGLEGMRLKAHIDQEDQIIHQIGVFLGWSKIPQIELSPDDPLEVLQLGDDQLVGVVSLQRNVEEDELVPGGVEQLFQKIIFLGIPPKRNEGKIFLAGRFLVFLEDDIVDVEFMQVLEEFLIGWGLMMCELNNQKNTIFAISAISSSSYTSKKAEC